MTDAWRGGPIISVTGNQAVKLQDRDPCANPIPGEHRWTMVAVHQVSRNQIESGNYTMDLESILTIAGPGCVLCEEIYEDVKDQPCPGPV